MMPTDTPAGKKKGIKAAAAVFQPSASNTENCWRRPKINSRGSTLFVDTTETH